MAPLHSKKQTRLHVGWWWLKIYPLFDDDSDVVFTACLLFVPILFGDDSYLIGWWFLLGCHDQLVIPQGCTPRHPKKTEIHIFNNHVYMVLFPKYFFKCQSGPQCQIHLFGLGRWPFWPLIKDQSELNSHGLWVRKMFSIDILVDISLAGEGAVTISPCSAWSLAVGCSASFSRWIMMA